MNIFTGVILAIAVSMDGLSAGIIYGMKDIKIPWFSQLVIVAATSCAFLTAMAFGNIAIGFFYPIETKFIGSILLSILGIWSLLETYARENSSISTKTIASFQIKPLGLVIKILREPIAADTDTSGIIDIGEALLLGAALAMDSFGAGFGAAAAGFGIIWTTTLVSIASLIFLSIGLYIGRKKLVFLNQKLTKYLPGILLLVLAFIKSS